MYWCILVARWVVVKTFAYYCVPIVSKNKSYWDCWLLIVDWSMSFWIDSVQMKYSSFKSTKPLKASSLIQFTGQKQVHAVAIWTFVLPNVGQVPLSSIWTDPLVVRLLLHAQIFIYSINQDSMTYDLKCRTFAILFLPYHAVILMGQTELVSKIANNAMSPLECKPISCYLASSTSSLTFLCQAQASVIHPHFVEFHAAFFNLKKFLNLKKYSSSLHCLHT